MERSRRVGTREIGSPRFAFTGATIFPRCVFTWISSLRRLSSILSTSIYISSMTSTSSCWSWRFMHPIAVAARRGDHVSVRPRLSAGLGRRRGGLSLSKTGRMAGTRRPGASRLRFRQPRKVPRFRLSSPRPSDRGTLGVSAGAYGSAPLSEIRGATLPPDRVLSNADHGLSGAGRPAGADPGRLCPARVRHRARRCAPVLVVLPRPIRDRILLRPLLRGSVASRMERHPDNVQWTRLYDGRRRTLTVLY